MQPAQFDVAEPGATVPSGSQATRRRNNRRSCQWAGPDRDREIKIRHACGTDARPIPGSASLDPSRCSGDAPMHLGTALPTPRKEEPRADPPNASLTTSRCREEASCAFAFAGSLVRPKRRWRVVLDSCAGCVSQGLGTHGVEHIGPKVEGGGARYIWPESGSRSPRFRHDADTIFVPRESDPRHPHRS